MHTPTHHTPHPHTHAHTQVCQQQDSSFLLLSAQRVSQELRGSQPCSGEDAVQDSYPTQDGPSPLPDLYFQDTTEHNGRTYVIKIQGTFSMHKKTHIYNYSG